MKLLIALFLLIATSVFGAVPAYTSFKGTSGILITSNPPTGDIIISGAGVFTSSGTNATIATSTNGVLVAVASTNINFVRGTNVVLTATNIGSVTHIGIHAISPIAGVAEGQSITVTTNGAVYTVAAGLKDFLMSSTNRFVWSNGTALVLSPTNDALYLFNTNNPAGIKPALIFSDGFGGTGFQIVTGAIISVVTVNSNLFPGTNRFLGRMLMRQLIMRDGSQEEGRFLRSVDAGGTATWAEVLTISNVVSLSVSNLTSKPITNSVITPGILYLYGLEAGTNVVLTMNGSNIVINSTGSGGGGPPGGDSGAIQFNQDDTFAGTNRFTFDRTNEILYVAGSVGIGTASPTYTLDVQAAIGSQRIVSTTSANETWLTFINNGAALIGLESGVPGTIVAGSSAYSFLLANQYAYPVQLATDNSVRLTILPTSGNVGINTVTPTNTLDVQGHTSLSSNLFLPNLPTNGSPIAVLAVDAAGKVYETAVPAGGGSSVAPPISSVQFNSNGVQQGSANFTFTNGQVYINNPGAVGSAQLTLANTTQAAEWDLAISSNPEVYLLGIRNGATFAMVFEPAGNVGIGTTNPGSRLDVVGRVGISPGPSLFATNALDVNGHASIRSNFFLANLPTNGSPIAFLATDAAGAVYETAVPSGGSSSSSDTNAVLTNLVNTVGRNVTNVVSLSTSNATSKPLTNSYTGGVLTLFGLEAGANVTVTPNGSNLVIAASGGGSPGGNSGAIQFNEGGTFAGTNLFVFDRTNNRVGIGIDTPATRLEVRSTTTQTRLAYDADTYASITVNSAGLTSFLTEDSATGDGYSFAQTVDVAYAAGDPTTFDLIRAVNNSTTSGAAAGIWSIVGGQNVGGIAFIRNGVASDSGSTALFYGSGSGLAEGMRVVHTTGRVGIGTVAPSTSLDVTGGIRSASLIVSNVTASRIAGFHTDKTLTNSRTSSDLFQMFFDMGISNIVAADSGIVIRTNAGSLTISNTVAAGGGTTPPGNSNQIPFLNVAGTAYMYAGYSSITNPGFGFSPSGPSVLNGGAGGLMVFADKVMGLVTIGHPNPASDFSTFATALVISNRYNGAGDFKNDMVKIDAVLVNASTLQADSTMTRWRVWQAPSGSSTNASTSSNDVAELTIKGQMNLANGTKYWSNSAVAFPTAAELGVGGFWVGVSNGPPATLVTKYSLDGTTVQTKVLAP